MKRTCEKSGKVGNLVYQRNRFGPICYQLFIPANPRTDKQRTVRGYLGMVSAYWRLLTDLERELWKAAGAKRRSRHRMGRGPLTGFNYFMKVNLRRLNRGGTLTEVPPEEELQRSVVRQVDEATSVSPRDTYGVAPVLLRRSYGILSVLPRCWQGVGTVLERGMRVFSA